RTAPSARATRRALASRRALAREDCPATPPPDGTSAAVRARDPAPRSWPLGGSVALNRSSAGTPHKCTVDPWQKREPALCPHPSLNLWVRRQRSLNPARSGRKQR